MHVFRFGKVYIYDEENADIAWSHADLLLASSYYATCRYYKYDENISYSLSYIYVSMKNHPELKYSEEHVNLLNTIINRVETA